MNTYKRYRFPPAIISYAVWLYFRFNPSHRDIEDLLAEEVFLLVENQLGYGVLNLAHYTHGD